VSVGYVDIFYLTVRVNSSSNINIANTHFSFYLTVMVNSSSKINIANTYLSSELTVMVNSSSNIKMEAFLTITLSEYER
jgi:hypothetical protein